MSAPDTNIKTQKRRHKPAIIGILAAIGFGAVMFLTVFFTSVDDRPSTVDDAVSLNAPVDP